MFPIYIAILRSIDRPVFKLGFSLLINNASRMCRSDLLVVAMILKFCDCNGCSVSLECLCIAENGGDSNGRSVLTKIPL